VKADIYYAMIGIGWGSGLAAANLTSGLTLALSAGFWPASMAWWLAKIVRLVLQ